VIIKNNKNQTILSWIVVLLGVIGLLIANEFGVLLAVIEIFSAVVLVGLYLFYRYIIKNIRIGGF